ncbi:MAG: class I SAM-dependent methyltransferase [Acidimicrobiia bacterium]|nr:class I SAM-dependent methyltransferase [Acidimicrobiia bacterium]
MIDQASVPNHSSVPNHHANFGGFSGPMGLIAALSMVFGREGDARLAARLSGLEPGDTVVDVGCGPGAAVRHAAALGASVTGVDPAPIMLSVARRLTHGRGARFVEGTAEALPIDDDSATVVWSIATAHHWADVEAGLREARRVLRAGGRLVVIERHTATGVRGHASHGWTEARAARFADRCRGAGFADIGIEQDTTGRRRTLSVIATSP